MTPQAIKLGQLPFAELPRYPAYDYQQISFHRFSPFVFARNRGYGREGAINPHTERNSHLASRNDRRPSPSQTDPGVTVPIQEQGQGPGFLRLQPCTEPLPVNRALNPEYHAEQCHCGTIFLIAYEGLSHFPSRSPETARRPSGVTATALTGPVWPSSGRIGVAIATPGRRQSEPPLRRFNFIDRAARIVGEVLSVNS
jgi:hypothetical protein